MITVHMIGNAHLDPVWLWGRSAGIDAALATARSACDRLDEYPSFVFTASASWFHEVIERHDPRLFVRVRNAVEEGRWRIVGGTIIQPDCNLPSAHAMRRQLRLGQEYFASRLGQRATVGYNVDSFGHGGYLPRFLREAGLDSYVFMRPQEHEHALPARLFRWRSPDGREVVAFRIARAYGTGGGADLERHVERALSDLPPGARHTMCFYGVGDHGGGPTRANIDWILQNAAATPGARLVLSHPRAFFDAVSGEVDRLPAVEGELQHHAIGCYAVERRIKVAMRRAEARLVQAEQALAALTTVPREQPGCPANTPEALVRGAIDVAWQDVLFNQFHDVLGGTCIEPASRLAAAELANAEAMAGDLLTMLTRQAFRPQAQPGVHQVVAFNPADRPFAGYARHEPWLQWSSWSGRRLVDESGCEIPCQAVEPEALVNGLVGLVFPLTIPARSVRLLRVEEGSSAGHSPAVPHASPAASAAVYALHCPPLHVDWADALRIGEWQASLEVFDDPTDTWSHSAINQYKGRRLGEMTWDVPAEVVEEGPLRAALRRQARFDVSRAWCRAMLLAGAPMTLHGQADGGPSLPPMVHLRISVVWGQARQMLRLRLASPGRIASRVDLVSGGPHRRALDGLEYPLGGGLWVGGNAAGKADANSLGIVAPEVFSLAVDEQGVSLLLVRSPHVAHHDPAAADARPDQPVTDQGSHTFDILLWPGCPDGPGSFARLAELADDLLAPPIIWDLTG